MVQFQLLVSHPLTPAFLFWPLVTNSKHCQCPRYEHQRGQWSWSRCL